MDIYSLLLPHFGYLHRVTNFLMKIDPKNKFNVKFN